DGPEAYDAIPPLIATPSVNQCTCSSWAAIGRNGDVNGIRGEVLCGRRSRRRRVPCCGRCPVASGVAGRDGGLREQRAAPHVDEVRFSRVEVARAPVHV